MELKKSRKYDLERTRPIRFILIFLSMVALSVIVMLSPIMINSIMNLQSNLDDEVIEDLNIDFKEEDEMIEAIQTETQDEVTEIIKPVETVTEAIDPPEETADLEASKEEIVETEKPLEEQKEELEEEAPMQEDKDAKPIANPEQEDLEKSQMLPEYPGGMSELVVWLNKNLKYPPSAESRKLKGEVEVAFFIEKDGTCTDFKVVKSANTLFDEEALRVCKMMPKWKPGRIKGKIVRTYFVIPVSFQPL